MCRLGGDFDWEEMFLSNANSCTVNVGDAGEAIMFGGLWLWR